MGTFSDLDDDFSNTAFTDLSVPNTVKKKGIIYLTPEMG